MDQQQLKAACQTNRQISAICRDPFFRKAWKEANPSRFIFDTRKVFDNGDVLYIMGTREPTQVEVDMGVSPFAPILILDVPYNIVLYKKMPRERRSARHATMNMRRQLWPKAVTFRDGIFYQQEDYRVVFDPATGGYRYEKRENPIESNSNQWIIALMTR